VKNLILSLISLLIFIFPTISLTQPIIIPPKTSETEVVFRFEGSEAQFYKKYGTQSFEETCEGIVYEIALIDDIKTHEVELFVLVSYIRCDKEYGVADYLYDGNDFLPCVGSTNEFIDNLFSIKMFQWFWYKRNGFNGFMYIPKYQRQVPIKIPSYVFQEIDLEYELWKTR